MRAEPLAAESAQAEKAGFVSAVRVHNALTAPTEKRLLIWMAQRMPRAITSDHLTALALTGQILAGAAYALSARNARLLWLVNFFLLLNWLGDSLDGTLARIRNRQRPRYGFYVDHIVDTFGAFALMAGLACSGFLNWKIAAGMLISFYVLSIESYLATYATGRFHLSHGFFGPTEIRILLAAGNVWVIFHPYVRVAGWQFRLFDVGGLAAIAGMTAMVLAAAIRRTALLYREETLR
ncbi:MAG TPA: CDP-alcohol phosphatidyltransferase family protein [Bryobacteraceae bacterium]|jgi:phosphatidylglycerophosphate synthase